MSVAGQLTSSLTCERATSCGRLCRVPLGNCRWGFRKWSRRSNTPRSQLHKEGVTEAVLSAEFMRALSRGAYYSGHRLASHADGLPD